MEDQNVNIVGDLERLGRSFERHLWAENKSPKTVTTYGESVTQMRMYLAGEGSPQPVRFDVSTWRTSRRNLLEKRSAAAASVRFGPCSGSFDG